MQRQIVVLQRVTQVVAHRQPVGGLRRLAGVEDLQPTPPRAFASYIAEPAYRSSSVASSGGETAMPTLARTYARWPSTLNQPVERHDNGTICSSGRPRLLVRRDAQPAEGVLWEGIDICRSRY
jgi:hypothetical protein